MKISGIDSIKQGRILENKGFQASKATKSDSAQVNYEQAPLGCFNQYAMSFDGLRLKAYDVNMHSLKIKGLPCPCCGKKMIPSWELGEFLKENKGISNCKEIIDKLKPYEDLMHDTEKRVFDAIKERNGNRSNLTLQQVICTLTPQNLKALIKSQHNIIGNIEELAKQLPKDESKQIRYITGNAKGIIQTNSSQNPFKRKKFIENIEKTLSKFEPSETNEKILAQAKSLYNSSNDASAFIVKYSRRSSGEIFERFLKPSGATIEHIHPHCTFKDPVEADKMPNLMLECAGCNNEKGDAPLTEQIKEHPEMKQNVQKHFDAFIDKINKGEVASKYKPEYLTGAAKTLEDESNGMLKIDVSKLKPETEHTPSAA